MSGPISRAVFFAALLFALTACSAPVENTASRTILETTPEELELAAKEKEYRAQVDAGQKAFDAKNIDDAIIQFERALGTNPKGFEAHLALARACAAKGNTEKAIKAYGAATLANPRLSDAYSERALLLERAGRLEDARTEYTQLIREDFDPKTTAKAYWLRSELADRLKKRADYRYDREQAMKLDADYEARVTAGDVVVLNHTEKPFDLMIEQLVNPDGTERTFPAGYMFPIIDDNKEGFLSYEGKSLVARSLRFTIKTERGSKTFTAAYEKGATLTINIYQRDLPK